MVIKRNARLPSKGIKVTARHQESNDWMNQVERITWCNVANAIKLTKEIVSLMGDSMVSFNTIHVHERINCLRRERGRHEGITARIHCQVTKQWPCINGCGKADPVRQVFRHTTQNDRGDDSLLKPTKQVPNIIELLRGISIFLKGCIH